MNYTINKELINEEDIIFVYSKNIKSTKVNKWAGIKVKDHKKYKITQPYFNDEEALVLYKIGKNGKLGFDRFIPYISEVGYFKKSTTVYWR